MFIYYKNLVSRWKDIKMLANEVKEYVKMNTFHIHFCLNLFLPLLKYIFCHYQSCLRFYLASKWNGNWNGKRYFSSICKYTGHLLCSFPPHATTIIWRYGRKDYISLLHNSKRLTRFFSNYSGERENGKEGFFWINIAV